MKTEAPATSDLQRYLENAQKRPASAPRSTFVPDKIKALEIIYDNAKSQVGEKAGLEMTEEEQKKLDELVKDLDKAKEILDTLKKDTPPIEFIFARPTDAEYKALTLFSEEEYQTTLRRLIGEELETLVERWLTAIETDAMIEMKKSDEKVSKAKKQEVFDETMNGLLADRLLEREGFTEEAAHSIVNTAELRLTEDEEEAIRPSESELGADALHARIESDMRREAIIQKKRDGILRRNLEQIEKRRASLMQKSRRELVVKLVETDLSERAKSLTLDRTHDAALFYGIRDANRPVHRGSEIIGYARAFEAIDALTTLRKAEDELYFWLLSEFDKVTSDQFNSISQVRDLAGYEPFRKLMESLPE